MNNKPAIDILMATYNGAPYIGAQIDSLLGQTCENWRLIIRDDGSGDDTVAIIRRYCASYPEKILFLDEGDRGLGAIANFSRLLRHAAAAYIMLCDQDDVWLPHKIDVTFEKLKSLEAAYGKTAPLLVHTDAKVVDANLREISPSLWQYQKSDPDRGSVLQRLLLQNVATGCTVMINKSLRDMALPIPEEAVMHDWWLALVAGAQGHMDYVSEPTILYRQHERNITGANQWNSKVAFRLAHNIAETIRSSRVSNLRAQNQAKSLSARYGSVLTADKRKMIDVYARLHERNYFMRRCLILQYGFFYIDTLRNIGRLLLA